VETPGDGDVRTNAELTEATASGLRWVTVARLGAEILLLGSMVVLARLIPPAAFGQFAIVIIVQELALSMPAEGIGSALVQRRSIGPEHLQGGLMLSLAVAAALISVTLALAAWVIAPLFGHDIAALVVLATPWFVLGAVYAIPVAVLRRRLDFRRLSILDLMSSLSRASVAIVLAAVAGLDAEALVLGNLAGMAAALGLALCFARVPLPRWRPAAMRDLLPYGGPAALACVAWTGFRNCDYAIVAARLGTAQAGFYWRGFQLAVEYQRKISMVMSQMAFPVLARTAGVEEMFALRRRMVQLLTVVILPLLVSLVLLAPELVPWVFGPAWEPAVLPTQILAGAGAATVIIDAVGSVLMAEGRSRALLVYGIAHFGVYAAAVLLAAGHGLAAVSVAAVLVHGAFVIVAYAVLLRGRSGQALRLLWHDVRAAAVCCVALTAVAAPLEWALRDAGAPAPVHLVAVCAAGAVAYLAALRAGFPPAWRDLAAALRRIAPGGADPASAVRRLVRAARRERRANAA
jgi:O-antigen/teichoic acid export membrane protein